jgi:acyl carrier protein
MSTIYTGSVEDRVKQCIHEITGVSLADIQPSYLLVNDLGLDSIELLETAMAIESEFDVEISDCEGEAVRTVQDAIDIVRSKVQP